MCIRDRDAASTVQATNKLEYVNLMEYLPLRYPPTLEEEKNRRIVSNFKRGRCSPELKNKMCIRDRLYPFIKMA